LSIEEYNEKSIKTLNWKEHIRKRPGMYVGKLGDGTSQEDGIYLLLKEVIDNSIDEHMMGFGKKIEVSISDISVKIRDFGRGVPLGKVKDVSSKMNTGAKYDSKVFKKSVGLNGIGIKAVNALSEKFIIRSFRDGEKKEIEYERGNVINDKALEQVNSPNGTEVIFTPDREIFGDYHFISEFVENQINYYAHLNSGLTIIFNGKRYYSKNGLLDLLNSKIDNGIVYPIIHLVGEDIEVAITHGYHYGEEYYTFVNGQNTIHGGTHLQAFREGFIKTVREFYKKDFDVSDIRTSIIAAISVKIEEPIFESQTKTKLGSKEMSPDGMSLRNYIGDFLKNSFDNYLHRNKNVADLLLSKILTSEKERKAMSGIKKLARERAKKANLHNKKLRDCRIHFNSNNERRSESTIFITEGDSASGSITKSRDVQTQAVFSLKGKPLNTYTLSKKIVYQNEEFNLLQAALNIEDGIENLRYNNIIIATDADVDGMHIRLLIITFFIKFFPEVVRKNHLYILQTPLFRVRNKKNTIYCYSEEEKNLGIEKLGKSCEVTRFKGLGEISPNEFKGFIGEKIKLEPVLINKEGSVAKTLQFYMGKNTPERQEFIIKNLKVEGDVQVDKKEVPESGEII